MEENDDVEEICMKCNGSGEGMYDGTCCQWCKGLGVDRTIQEYYDDLPDPEF